MTSKTNEKRSDREGNFLQMKVTSTANLTLVVSNLVQSFRPSSTETISWFVAEGELVQFNENFDRLERSQMRHRMLHELYQSQTAKVLIERCENFPEPHLDENYCQFGCCSGIGDNVRPIADICLKSDIYDYVEKAFMMPCPQIEFELRFTQAIQRAEMSLIFYKPPEPGSGGLSNHFTLETDAVGGTGLWYADCKLVEIKNVSKHAGVVTG